MEALGATGEMLSVQDDAVQHSVHPTSGTGRGL